MPTSMYTMWDKLQHIVNRSKQYDFTGVGLVALGSMAYYAYFLHQELLVQETTNKAYLAYINQHCLYIINKKPDGLAITQPWPETRPLELQQQEARQLALLFQKKAKRLQKTSKKPPGNANRQKTALLCLQSSLFLEGAHRR